MSVVIASNLYNLAMVVVFVARAGGHRTTEQRAGLFTVCCGWPLIVASTAAALSGQQLWEVLLPLPLAAHCAIELVVDYVHPVEFRATRWLWPYLALFYLGQWLLVGYAFRISDTAGKVTLSTYFVCLAATFYSYRRVGHGSRPPTAIERQ